MPALRGDIPALFFIAPDRAKPAYLPTEPHRAHYRNIRGDGLGR